MTTSHVLLLLIDHDADLIAAICGETMMLDFGKRLAMGPTRAVLDDPLHAHRQRRRARIQADLVLPSASRWLRQSERQLKTEPV